MLAGVSPVPPRPATCLDTFGADIVTERVIFDGIPCARCPHDAFYFYYRTNELQAVRSGPWKLVLPHTYTTLHGRPGGRDGKPVNYEPAKAALELYDMQADPDEKHNVIADHPDEVKRLEVLVERARADLGDALAQRTGAGVREPGRAEP